MRLRTMVVLLVTVPVLAPILYLLGTGQLFSLPVMQSGPLWLEPFIPMMLFLGPIAFVVFMFRRFDRALKELVRETRRLATGNRTKPIHVTGTAELDSLTQSIEELRLALNQDQERRAFLLMGLSHDFRTPLTLIQGYSEAIEDELDETSPAVTKYLEVIRDRTAQMERMVGRWIELVRLETGERLATFETVGVQRWLNLLWQRFQSDVTVLGRTFEGSIVVGDTTEVVLDPELMERVLENLLSNAIKHTPVGKAIRWKATQNERALTLDLIDEGTGIPAVDLPYIWDPFFRSKDVTHQGWGLGLSIVKNIINAHGFSIAVVESGPQGTWFQIVIPVQVSEAKDPDVDA